MRIMVVGAEYGLGKEVAKRLDYLQHTFTIKVIESDFNVRYKDQISQWFENHGSFDGLIYCAGVNHINYFDDSPEADFWESMDVNCYGFIRVLKLIRKMNIWNPGMRCCLITSNAANVAMRHSLAYNCSKAAANMAIKQMAREIPPTEQMIFGVAPNKLEGTPMSLAIEKKVCEMRGWDPITAKVYQLKALPARKETDPKALALFIIGLMTQSHYFPYIHGNILPFGGPV